MMLQRSIEDSVFKIYTSQGTGSGFYLSEHDVIVTNHHVVAGSRRVCLEGRDRNRHPAQVILTDPQADLAFLSPENGWRGASAKLSNGKAVQAHDVVYVLGYPFGMPFTVTEGIVSSARQFLDGQFLIQTDAAVNPGNSGGPLVNELGEVVGVTVAKFTEADNVGFAIPVQTLRDTLEDLKHNPDRRFAIKCTGCGKLIFEKTEYCPHCGNALDKTWFEEVPLTFLASSVEQSLQESGVDPVLTRGGFEFWEYYRGETLIRIFVTETYYLTATAPICELPRENLEPLYEHLLSEKSPWHCGIFQNHIYMSYRMHVTALTSSRSKEVLQHLADFPLASENMRLRLEERFGALPSAFSLSRSRQ
jgi:hypothetical protein